MSDSAAHSHLERIANCLMLFPPTLENVGYLALGIQVLVDMFYTCRCNPGLRQQGAELK